MDSLVAAYRAGVFTWQWHCWQRSRLDPPQLAAAGRTRLSSACSQGTLLLRPLQLPLLPTHRLTCCTLQEHHPCMQVGARWEQKLNYAAQMSLLAAVVTSSDALVLAMMLCWACLQVAKCSQASTTHREIYTAALPLSFSHAMAANALCNLQVTGTDAKSQQPSSLVWSLCSCVARKCLTILLC